jgi:hypothetical protein
MFGREAGERGFGRTKEEIAAFFDGFDLEPPGLASVSRWRPGAACGSDGDGDVWLYAGVGRTVPTGRRR